MENPGFRLAGSPISRRTALAALAAWFAALPRAAAFGQLGSFHPRIMATTGRKLGGPRRSSPARWAWEVARRTSAPARLVPAEVSASASALLAEPFAVWSGASGIPALTLTELTRLRQFLLLGGLLLVDDSDPEHPAFGQAARRELVRVIPDSPIVKLESDHVLYRSYYLLERPVGRVLGPPYLEAMVRGPAAQVIFSAHDLLGAMASPPGGDWLISVTPGGANQREHAIRLATNIAMYLLCSDYKDDAVHAPELMRRRARRRP